MNTQPTEDSIVLLSSPGMHEMADRITKMLTSRDNRFMHCMADYNVFANGEIKPHIPETVRGKSVYFLHPMLHPDPNVAVMKLLLTTDALKRASASSISLVLPFIPYLRQDRKDEPRVPISARVLADMIETNHKVDRIITLDMHADQEQGFFSIPVDNLYGMVVHTAYFKRKYKDDFSSVIVAAPDFGGAVRARRFAARLGSEVPVLIIEKKRVGYKDDGANSAETMELIGPDVTGKDVIMYDDMIDTGGSIMAAGKTLLEKGAKSVCAVVTHGLFSAEAEKRFKQADMQVVAVETIPRDAEYCNENESWLCFLSIDKLVAESIYESSLVGGSVSKMFE